MISSSGVTAFVGNPKYVFNAMTLGTDFTAGQTLWLAYAHIEIAGNTAGYRFSVNIAGTDITLAGITPLNLALPLTSEFAGTGWPLCTVSGGSTGQVLTLKFVTQDGTAVPTADFSFDLQYQWI